MTYHIIGGDPMTALAEMDQLIEDIRTARLTQAAIKEQLQTAQLELEVTEAELYLDYDGKHTEAKEYVTTRPDVKALRGKIARLETEHYKAWIESARLNQRFSVRNKIAYSEQYEPGLLDR